MANDPLSLPDLLGEPRSETDYQAVHAELMATKHGRDFLAEYARRNLDPETRKFVSTMARLESAMRDHQVPQISATMLQGLGDLARAIEQSEAVFLAAGDSAANDFLAVQRIQDIGMALRRRDVEPALCDALDEAAREIGDAMVRGNAAMVGKLSSASLLRDLRERVNDLIAFCESATSPGTNEHDGDDSQHETATFDERKSRDDAGPLFAIATEKTANDESRGAIDAMRFDNTRNECCRPTPMVWTCVAPGALVHSLTEYRRLGRFPMPRRKRVRNKDQAPGSSRNVMLFLKSRPSRNNPSERKLLCRLTFCRQWNRQPSAPPKVIRSGPY